MMKRLSYKPESELYQRLKWLMFFRLIFSTLLLSATIVLQLTQTPHYLSISLIALYALIALIFCLSFFYALMLPYVRDEGRLAFCQVIVDTLIVSLIIHVTGGFNSIFSFLYLLVIVCASLLLNRPGNLIIAMLCILQYSLMVNLEYYNILNPIGYAGSTLAERYDWTLLLYKAGMTMAACLIVAFLSSIFAEQVRRGKNELKAMAEHVKRVEKMAAIGEMAAGLAHEIKNPLASLGSSIQILKEDIPYDPDHEKLMQIIQREASRLSSLASNFLLFARPSAGRRQPVDLKAAILEVTELLENDRRVKDRIIIKKDLGRPLTAQMDPEHCRQILWNILTNAVEAIEGTGQIEILLQPARTQMALIQIHDNGCGISEHLLKQIYDPFFTTKPRGTGLGLSIVHRILEASGGQMDIGSTCQGATVRLYLKTI